MQQKSLLLPAFTVHTHTVHVSLCSCSCLCSLSLSLPSLAESFSLSDHGNSSRKTCYSLTLAHTQQGREKVRGTAEESNMTSPQDMKHSVWKDTHRRMPVPSFQSIISQRVAHQTYHTNRHGGYKFEQSSSRHNDTNTHTSCSFLAAIISSRVFLCRFHCTLVQNVSCTRILISHSYASAIIRYHAA